MRTPSTQDGHTFSPRIREQSREVERLYSQVPELAAKGKAAFDDLFAVGHGHWQDGSTQMSRECFCAAYVMARELNYRLGEAMSLERAALCYLRLKEPNRALSMLSGAIRLYEGEHVNVGVASALSNIGQAHVDLCQLDEARDAFHQSRMRARREYDCEVELGSCVKGAMLELREGHAAEAVELLGQALGLAVALGDPTEEVRRHPARHRQPTTHSKSRVC